MLVIIVELKELVKHLEKIEDPILRNRKSNLNLLSVGASTKKNNILNLEEEGKG